MENALGARIRTLRERAGMQSQELASRLGIDPSAMSNIERGRRSVKTGELMKIAEALSVSPLALLDEDSLPARMPVALRRDGQSSSIRGAAYSRLLALSEIHAVLSDADLPTTHNLRQAPQVNLGSWRADADGLARWASGYLDVQCGAERFSRLARAIEDRLHVDVLVEEYEDDPLSGAAITDRAFPLIFVNSRHPTPRALFTLAHELGHLLIGHNGSIAVDDDFIGDTPAERQANAFAAAFLMPEDKVDDYIEEFDRGPESLAHMIYGFGVSFESLIFRLHNLRKIDAAGRDRLREVGWQGLLSVIGRSELQERLGPEISMRLISRMRMHPAVRPPIWLASRCLTAYRQGVISIRPLAGLFHADPDLFLDRIQEHGEKSAEILETVEEPIPDYQISDDELFAGSPVS